MLKIASCAALLLTTNDTDSDQLTDGSFPDPALSFNIPAANE
jgi:hypothetical protein